MPGAKTKEGHICAACFKPATLRCARCRAVWYCSKECQTRDWKLGHRALCRPAPADAAAEPAPPAAVPEPPADAVLPPRPRAWLVSPGAVLALAAEPLAVPPLRCGLRNIDGWSCFMNSVLQALLAAAPFRTLLLSRAHSASARRSGPPCPAPCVLCWLERFAVAHAEASMGRGNGAAAASATSEEDEGTSSESAAKSTSGTTTTTVLTPIELAAMLPSLDEGLEPGMQHDAHEFLGALLRRCAEAGARGCADGAVAQTGAVAQLVGGWLCRTVACARCGGASTTHERFVTLSADVTPATATLDDALRSLCAPEALDGADRYRCNHCGTAVRATTQLRVAAAPPVLVVHLKRFRAGVRGKCAQHVAFPERLSLRAFMPRAAAANAPTYRLCAVVVHCDIAGFVLFGHYVAFVRASDGAWHLADDARVVPVPASRVLAAQAYLLVYQQVPARTRPLTTTNVDAVRDALLAASHPELLRTPQTTSSDGPSHAAGTEGETQKDDEEAAPPAPQMCPTGCGFYGSAATRGYCSVCFRRHYPAEAKQLEEERKRREERERAERLQRRQEEEAKRRERAAAAAEARAKAAQDAPAAPVATTAAAAVRKQTPKTGGKVPRNAPCPCGSGLKYKECHGKLN